MKRVLILVEGQTEEAFCLEVLRTYFASRAIHIDATRIATSVKQSRRAHRGGHGNQFTHIERDLRRLLGDTSAAMITTMIDYYALPHDFPGLTDRPTRRSAERANHVELAWAAHVGNTRFLPHLTLHEFEALIFAGPGDVAQYFNAKSIETQMERVSALFNSPEEIDEGRDTCASRRLLQIIPEYVKSVHGPILGVKIGLARIRDCCPHFNQWLCRIENLADTAQQ